MPDRCRPLASCLPALLLSGLFAPSASAQGISPSGSTSAVSPSPYWGYSFDPYGVASTIRAQGQYMIYQQEAIKLREENIRAKLDTRRKELEHWVWEREFKRENFERERKAAREREIEKSKTDTPLTEILDASCLNVLLVELKKLPNLSQATSVHLDAVWLPHIHITFITTGAGGSMGLLKKDHLVWPQILRREGYATERERFNKLMVQAKQEALRGVVRSETIGEGRQLVDGMEERVLRDIRAGKDDYWSFSDGIGARRALNEFRNALRMLEREDAAVYLQPLKASNVVELVDFMKASGLSFSPATTGDERFYISLHRAMAQELTQAPK